MATLYDVQACMRMSILMHTNFSGIMHVNTLHFANRGGASPDSGDLLELEEDWYSNASAQYLDMFPTTFELYQLDIRAIFGGVPVASSTSWNSDGTRTVEGDYLPPYACSVVSFRPMVASKRWHGKNYYGGLVEADQVNGSLQAGILADIGTYMAAMFTRFGPSGASPFQWVVVSDPSHQLPLLEGVGDPGIVTPSAMSVDSYHVGSFVRTQKRRDFGRGQ